MSRFEVGVQVDEGGVAAPAHVVDAAEEDEPIVADDESAVDEAGDVLAANPGNRVQLRIDYSGADVFVSGSGIQQPANPYFVTQMKGTSRANELYIPMDIIKGYYNVQLPDYMMAVDSHGRRFPIKRKTWKDGRTVYNGGWRSICKLNLAREGDRIICEFVTTDTGALQLNVRFVSSNRLQ